MRQSGPADSLSRCFCDVYLLRVQTLLHLQHLLALLQQSCDGRHMLERQRHRQILVRAAGREHKRAHTRQISAQQRRRTGSHVTVQRLLLFAMCTDAFRTKSLSVMIAAAGESVTEAAQKQPRREVETQ